MKADMEAMKEQMGTMMEAMMSMKKIMEANAVAIAATSAIAKVDPTPLSGLNQINHPTSHRVGQGGKELGSTGGPNLCKFRKSMRSCHMACLTTMHHLMWCTLPMRMSINPIPYSLRANNPNLIMHMSLNPWWRHMKEAEIMPLLTWQSCA